MGTVTSVLVAAFIGVALAVATTFTVVEAAQQSPEKTKQVEQPLVQYGERR